MTTAMILAAGSGRRMGGSVPKQFLDLCGKPILAYTLEVFQQHPGVDRILAVCPEGLSEPVRTIAERYGITKLTTILTGGATRRDSSRIGTEWLEKHGEPTDVVLIHDGVRPNVEPRVIDENIRQAQIFGACETAVETCDTIAVSSEDGFVDAVPSRRLLWNVQTPQSFQVGVIVRAHALYQAALETGEPLPEITDDAGLVLFAEQREPTGQRVRICRGNGANLKVTKPEDLHILLSILQNRGGGSPV